MTRLLSCKKLLTALVGVGLFPHLAYGADASLQACTQTVKAKSGDTCASIAEANGISVTQFLFDNPTISSCSELVVGQDYCIAATGIVSPTSPNPSSSSAQPAPTSSPTPGLQVSKDGTCGNGFTCQGSEYGDCCSSHGYCGQTGDYCLAGCQPAFGICQSGSGSALPPGTELTSTITITLPPSSCSQASSCPTGASSTYLVTRTSVVVVTVSATSLDIVTSTVQMTTTAAITTTAVRTSTATTTSTAVVTRTATNTAVVTQTTTNTAIVTQTSTNTERVTQTTTDIERVTQTTTSTAPQVTSTVVKSVTSTTIMTLTSRVVETSTATSTTTYNTTVTSTSVVVHTSVTVRTATTIITGTSACPAPTTVTTTRRSTVTSTEIISGACSPTKPDTTITLRPPPRQQPSPSPTPESNSILPGAVSDCNKYYKVGPDDTCRTVARKNGISESEFLRLNPGISNDALNSILCTPGLLQLILSGLCQVSCAALWEGYYVCVGH